MNVEKSVEATGLEFHKEDLTFALRYQEGYSETIVQHLTKLYFVMSVNCAHFQKRSTLKFNQAMLQLV